MTTALATLLLAFVLTSLAAAGLGLGLLLRGRAPSAGCGGERAESCGLCPGCDDELEPADREET